MSMLFLLSTFSATLRDSSNKFCSSEPVGHVLFLFRYITLAHLSTLKPLPSLSFPEYQITCMPFLQVLIFNSLRILMASLLWLQIVITIASFRPSKLKNGPFFSVKYDSIPTVFFFNLQIFHSLILFYVSQVTPAVEDYALYTMY